MNLLVENQTLEEMECGSNFAYILKDNGIFLPTEYKVLQSQANGIFVKCMRMMYNGQVELYYSTKSLKPFLSIIGTLETDRFLVVVANLLSDIMEVKGNGFLSCQKIDISFNRIYVDASTCKVSLVYVPVKNNIHEEESNFENELRTNLVKLIASVSSLSSPKTLRLSAELSNGLLSLEDLYNGIKEGWATERTFSMVSGREKPQIKHAPTAQLRIIAINAPVRFEISVNKDAFILGKKQELCDGVIGFNKMISRVHCKICRSGSGFTVTDLSSANGTFVNMVRLQPNQPYPIRHGDRLRLANTDFQICVE